MGSILRKALWRADLTPRLAPTRRLCPQNAPTTQVHVVLWGLVENSVGVAKCMETLCGKKWCACVLIGKELHRLAAHAPLSQVHADNRLVRLAVVAMPEEQAVLLL